MLSMIGRGGALLALLAAGLAARSQAALPHLQQGRMSPEMEEMKKAQDRLIKEAAPEFYAYQLKLRRIETRIAAVVAKLSAGEIDKEAAKDAVRPLVQAQQEILNDPEYLVESRLSQAVFSSPEYQERMQGIMRSLSDKRERPTQAGVPQTP